MADFTDDQVEDGTSKSGALVYESIANITASDGWLDLRGYGSLAGGEEATQKSAMLRATTLVEAALRRFLRGVKVTAAQARLWPLGGAYASDGTLFTSSEVPAAFLEGWRLACEKMHAGTLCLPSPGLADVDSLQVSVSEPGENAGSKSVSVQRRPGPFSNPIIDDPEIWPLFAPILPP